MASPGPSSSGPRWARSASRPGRTPKSNSQRNTLRGRARKPILRALLPQKLRRAPIDYGLPQWSTRKEAQHAIFEYIEAFYSRERRRSLLGHVSPETFEARYRVGQVA